MRPVRGWLHRQPAAAALLALPSADADIACGRAITSMGASALRCTRARSTAGGGSGPAARGWLHAGSCVLNENRSLDATISVPTMHACFLPRRNAPQSARGPLASHCSASAPFSCAALLLELSSTKSARAMQRDISRRMSASWTINESDSTKLVLERHVPWKAEGQSLVMFAGRLYKLIAGQPGAAPRQLTLLFSRRSCSSAARGRS